VGLATLAVTLCLAWAPQAGGAEGDEISVQCSPAPSTCNGSGTWQTSAVTVTFYVTTAVGDSIASSAGCGSQLYADAITSAFCEVWWTGGAHQLASFPVKVEASEPTATATASRPPDSNGWYNHPVAVSFNGGTSFSGFGVEPCQQVTYSGPDALGTTVLGSCTDRAGKTATAGLTLSYDATPPTVTGATATRPPDFNGWYNHPVSFVFTGADASSGIESCATAAYAGPDSSAAQLVGGCRDRAGNVATLAVRFRYDATPPALSAEASPGDGEVILHWQSGAAVELIRSPGLRGASTSVLYRGGRTWFDDATPANGKRYTYTLRAKDEAGNTAVRKVVAIPGRRLLAPASDARLTGAPLLRWTPVRHAGYYNVQLYREGKVLSAWPRNASLQLGGAWEFAGHRYHLAPGTYRWFVWPGFGPRAAARYGPIIGATTFVIDRQA
jgi:hypothetical protein